ncbi:MAG: gamma-glutamyltransferase [Rhizobiales bacterium]|nr:gamma-glutamyltransferase [Hyphomicrobiales bacterium]
MIQLPRLSAALVALLAAASLCFAQSETPAPRYATSTPIPAVQPVVARHGMVVAQESRAARIGATILEQGGNAIDAAVAVGFAMAVTYPKAGNLGGGGFMLIHQPGSDPVAIDYRETAPHATTRDVFLDAQREADPRKSRETGLGVGVPGTVAGLTLAHKQFGSGKFSLADLIAPAIRMAREGFPVEDDTADSLPRVGQRLARWPSTAKIFLPDGALLGLGDRLIQTDLAATLAAIAREGPRAFYVGPIADRIVEAVRGAGGRMTRTDLESYMPILRRPVRGSYRGYEIISMPPPSSGGVHLVEILNILEGFDLRTAGPGSADALHLMIEAMKRAYADRAVFLGDPDSVKVPVAGLTSKDYAAQLRSEIDIAKARPSSAIRLGEPAPPEGDNTTHFSVVDRDGNAVANTYTLNLSYGLGLVAEGTGVLLNNELDDFAAKPFAPNAYGLVGFAANAPGPDKRPLSSMTPTIVLKGGEPVLITGSPGGSRIITAVLQVIVNVIDHGMSVARAVSYPRVHHQWLPDRVLAEPGLPAASIQALEARGHAVVPTTPFTSTNSIAVTPDGLVGAADTRTRGSLAVGY